MTPALIVAATLAAPASAPPPPAAPTLETAFADARALVLAVDLGPQINALAWDLQRGEQESRRLRQSLSWLAARARAYRPVPGKPDPDALLRGDLMSFGMSLSSLSRDLQWKLDDLRRLTAQAEKDPNAAVYAASLASAAQMLRSETGWLAMDARFAYSDLLRAGFVFEATTLEQNARDIDGGAQQLETEARALLSKVGG